jgi:hypothetical protein
MIGLGSVLAGGPVDIEQAFAGACNIPAPARPAAA